MTDREVTVLEPTNVVDENRDLRRLVAEQQRLLRQHDNQVTVSTGMQGWQIMVCILAGIMMVISFLWSVINLATQSSEKSADRSHELAMKAVDEMSTMAQSANSGALETVLVYAGLFIAGCGVIWWTTTKSGVIP